MSPTVHSYYTLEEPEDQGEQEQLLSSSSEPEAVDVTNISEPELSVQSDSGMESNGIPQGNAVERVSQEPPSPIPNYDNANTEFLTGYREAGGPPELEGHLLGRVLPCESGGAYVGTIDWTPGNPDYRSAAQFHPGTWEYTERVAGRYLRFEDPRDVGTAVAIWLRYLIDRGTSPGSTSGWPVCWWR